MFNILLIGIFLYNLLAIRHFRHLNLFFITYFLFWCHNIRLINTWYQRIIETIWHRWGFMRLFICIRLFCIFICLIIFSITQPIFNYLPNRWDWFYLLIFLLVWLWDDVLRLLGFVEIIIRFIILLATTYAR